MVMNELTNGLVSLLLYHSFTLSFAFTLFKTFFHDGGEHWLEWELWWQHSQLTINVSKDIKHLCLNWQHTIVPHQGKRWLGEEVGAELMGGVLLSPRITR
jgi:hypothetical protein